MVLIAENRKANDETHYGLMKVFGSNLILMKLATLNQKSHSRKVCFSFIISNRPHTKQDFVLTGESLLGKPFRNPKPKAKKEGEVISVLPQTCSSVKRPYFVEFNYIFDKLAKRRQKQKRQRATIIEGEEVAVAEVGDSQFESISDEEKDAETFVPVATNYEVLKMTYFFKAKPLIFVCLSSLTMTIMQNHFL